MESAILSVADNDEDVETVREALLASTEPGPSDFALAANGRMAKRMKEKDAEIATLKADNAALVRAARATLADCSNPHGTFKTLIKSVQEMGSVVNQPHSGALLLTAHQNAMGAVRDLLEALDAVRPPERAPGCWCHHARDVAKAGHSDVCIEAQGAVAAAKRLL